MVWWLCMRMLVGGCGTAGGSGGPPLYPSEDDSATRAVLVQGPRTAQHWLQLLAGARRSS